MQFLSKLLPASHMRLITACVGVVMLIVLAGFTIYEMNKTEVLIVDNGEEQTVQTHAKTVEELLDDTGITVGEHDEVSPSLDTNIRDGMTIEYKTANQVIVSIDDQKQTYYTTKNTVGAF